jgi:acetyl-CoA carboxylase biotin carboxyl carrier protein
MPTSTPSADTFDARLVRRLADILNETGLSEIEVEGNGMKIRVARALASPTTVFAPAPMAAPATPPPPATPTGVSAPPPEPVRAGDVVKSPMVGTVYLQPQPGAPPFAKVGDVVSAGQTLLLVEAMKTMNPIAAPKAGKILEFLVADAQPVEFGEPLVVIG